MSLEDFLTTNDIIWILELLTGVFCVLTAGLIGEVVSIRSWIAAFLAYVFFLGLLLHEILLALLSLLLKAWWNDPELIFKVSRALLCNRIVWLFSVGWPLAPYVVVWCFPRFFDAVDATESLQEWRTFAQRALHFKRLLSPPL